ncbi:MAG TPA: Sir2 family NAD-dependent protein deacetylase [Kofleriaceae bacterium]|nr:Sir2 family NAD-dependent protein deacetylase [Kofleriaceae bacterium]
MFSGYKQIVVLTGAGISQAAGLPTYRGPGGLWNDPSKIALSSIEALRANRAEACAMFWQLYTSAREVKPTAAHRALAAFEAALPPKTDYLLITQNVDGLHQAAGSKRVCEFHGSLARWKCEVCGAQQTLPSEPTHCGEPMRPCAVLFGEEIPAEAEHTAKRALRDCDLFVAIGTSGTVIPAASFVRWAEYAGARRVLLNLEIDNDARGLYSECHAGTADELVAKYFV